MSNRLAKEKSPYLLQHAHNPVDWYSWGEEAFEKAKKEDKPIFLSIGYATCHWCHVMERESFENDEIAKFLNENFVSIKVDREERPDVDHIYMTAVQMMTGAGGWPLTAFLDHQLRPFFAGTYFPPTNRWGRPGFNELLSQISRLWKLDKAKAIQSGEQMAAALQEMGKSGTTGKPLTTDALKKAYVTFANSFDARDGGFGRAPKFPRSETLSLLLRIHRRTGEANALKMATHTLEKMARGGIYDQLGGGFHRYSTDAQWLTPHFEKMLYDNALLVKTYLEAYQVDANPLWAGVVRETLDYVLREMTSPEGGFYSAQDADSEGVEGKFYVWSEEELQKLLTVEEFQKVKEVFQTSSNGNFEGHNIFTFKEGVSWTIRQEEPLKSAMPKLLKYRSSRIWPITDDKTLTSWNGLMISAMAVASQVLGEEKYLKAAQKAGDFLLKRMWDGKTLKRRYRDGEVRFDGSLDDYSFFIQALLDLYESDFDTRWFEAAVGLQKKVEDLFWDSKDGGYFSTAADEAYLLARAKDVYDGALPSGNSVTALNLLRLYALTAQSLYRDRAENIFKTFSEAVSYQPHGSPALLCALDFATDASKEIVIAGQKDDPQVKNFLKEIHKIFLPNKVLALADHPDRSKLVPLLEGKIPQSGETTLYVCENQTCRQPALSVAEASSSLTSKKAY